MTEWSVAPLIFNRDIKYTDKWLSAYPSRFLVEKKPPVPLNTRRSTLQYLINSGNRKTFSLYGQLFDHTARSLLSIVRSWLRFMSEWNISMFKLDGGNDGWRCLGGVNATHSSEIFYLLLIIFILLFPFLPVLFIDPYSWKLFVVSFIALASRRLR